MNNNAQEPFGSFFIARKQVEKGGEFHHHNSNHLIFAGKSHSLHHIMIELNLIQIQEEIERVREEFSAIQETKVYSESESFYFWNVFIHFTNILFHNSTAKSDRRKGFPCLPETFKRATEIFDAQPWSQHRSGTRKVGYKTPSEKIPEHLRPKKTKGAVFLYELENLRRAFESDLKHIRVIQLEENEASLYDNAYPIGIKITKQFPTIRDDILEAAKSLALNRPTACVFHLSRVAEIVTQDLASRYGISPDWPDKQQPKHKEGKKCWGDFIVALEMIMGPTLESTKIPGRNADERTYLSHAMVASRKLKTLRNDTDHIYLSLSEFYDIDEARLIWKRTKEFIKNAASIMALPKP